MITLSIVAAGIIALAAALLARPSPEPRAADQRGITLQTLIVTAVLVAMSFVAAAIIIAITNTQEQNLEDSSRANTTDANCEPWEIYDITRAAAGRGGGFGGIGSSGEGCIRVCYVRATTAGSNFDTTATPDQITDGETDGAANLELVFSRSNIANNNTQASGVTNVLVVTDTDELSATNTEQDPTGVVDLDDLEIVPAGDAAVRDYDSEQMTIKLARNQKYCQIVDAQGDELLRSVDA